MRTAPIGARAGSWVSTASTVTGVARVLVTSRSQCHVGVLGPEAQREAVVDLGVRPLDDDLAVTEAHRRAAAGAEQLAGG